MIKSDPQLAKALQFDRQGRLAEAVAAYREILSSQPRNGDVRHRLAVALARLGRTPDAIAQLTAAVEVEPQHAGMRANLGKMLSELGRHAEALACYDQALSLQPALLAAHRGRGAALVGLGKFGAAVCCLEQSASLAPADADTHADLAIALACHDRKAEALRSIARAISLAPDHVRAHYHRGCIERDLGNLSAALASLRHASGLQPRHPAIHHDLGRVLLQLGRADEAVSSFDTALALSAGSFETHFYRGVALSSLDRHEDGLAAFDRALALRADSVETHNNRGVTLAQLSRPAEALTAFQEALALQPDHADAHTNAGNTMKALQHYDEAVRHFDRALAIKPDDPMTLWSKALLQLTRGEFRDGWALYESRLRLPQFLHLQRHFGAPRWWGTDHIEGRRVLVYAEQGLGDTLQFCRYLPLLEAMGAKLIFEVQPVLTPLMESLALRGTVLGAGNALPPVDLVCPLLSLPLAMRTETATIPDKNPYLQAEPASTGAWKKRLAAFPGRSIGLNWRGNLATESQPWLRGRSFGLAAAARLAGIPGVTWVSLQKGPGAADRHRGAFGTELRQLTDPMDEGPAAMAETAALLTALDLVITSDTAVAHLAGALGVPVWVVLHYVPDWRWGIAGESTPWYPTMRLFRQRIPGDWPEVFARIARELGAATESTSGADWQ